MNQPRRDEQPTSPNSPAAAGPVQASGGFSIEVAAIVFTGLIGMIGYVVQARSAQRATKAQTDLEREAAEREKAEAKAGKQLQRVHLQLAEFVVPVQARLAHFYWAFNGAVPRFGLEDYATVLRKMALGGRLLLLLLLLFYTA